jgi:transposase-like protein
MTRSDGDAGPAAVRRKRFLSPEQKFELWMQLVRQEATQRELAHRWGVDRSTVIKVRQVAKEGALAALAASRPGVAADAVDARVRTAEAEIARLTDTIKEQAVELAALRGKSHGAW